MTPHSRLSRFPGRCGSSYLSPPLTIVRCTFILRVRHTSRRERRCLFYLLDLIPHFPESLRPTPLLVSTFRTLLPLTFSFISRHYRCLFPMGRGRHYSTPGSTDVSQEFRNVVRTPIYPSIPPRLSQTL